MKNFEKRIGLAKATGFSAVEFWHWKNKKLSVVEDEIGRQEIPISAMLAEPTVNLTNMANQQQFLEGLEESLAIAKRLKVPTLIAQAGNKREGFTIDADFDSLVFTT